MHAVPSTLHQIMKYFYNNKVYQIEMDLNPESFLQVEKGNTSSQNTLIPTSHIETTKEETQDMGTISKLLDE
jgi:hypothetical protein